MDSRTLESLKAALAASPDNVALALVVAQAHLDRGEGAEAHALVRDRDLAGLRNPGDRHVAARALLAGGAAAAALALLDADDPDTLLLRARALHALERSEDARSAYHRAVAQSPTLEDPTLLVELESRAGREAPRDPDSTRPRLRVIDGGAKNDDLSTLLRPAPERITFADVGGLDHVKEQVRRRIILPFQKPSLFQRFRKKAGGGVLLYGPPGCGKTLIARATAGECGAAFFNVAISDVLDMWLGESESKLHALFEKARASAPAVLFFDEVEALGGKRQFSRDATTAKVVSQFLAELDGFSQDNHGVLVLAATNLPWAVDAAFHRPGRFDRYMLVPPPDREARAAILRIHLAGRPVDDAVDPGPLAQRTSGFSGADLMSLVETAADFAIEESLAAEREVPIRQEHLRKALEEVKPTTLEWLTTARNHARYANEGGQYDEVLAFLRAHGKE